MNPPIVAILGFTILVPDAIAIFKIKSISNDFLPLILMIWIGCINEILSFIIIKSGWETTMVHNNIYVLLESLLIFSLFRNKIVLKSNSFYYAIIASLILIWLRETFLITNNRSK